MVGFIFGIIVFIISIIATICLASHCEEDEHWENGLKVKEKEYPLRHYAPYSFIGGTIIAFLLTFFGMICNVPTGHTGVVTVFGKVENETLDNGFHLKKPWEKIIKLDNRIQKKNVELSCFSSDIQEVSVSYTVNYQISSAQAQEIYKDLGKNYYDVVIAPSIKECVKTICAKYTAEQLVGSREELAKGIAELLDEKLFHFNIELVNASIEDIDFTDSFTNAVEAKQVADQKSKQAKIEQEQAKMEATYEKEIAEIKANAQAEVAKIQAQADMEVAKISADSAEYQGKKEAAIALQRLASINGWTVVTNEEGINELYKADGNVVSPEELKIGTENLMRYYYTIQWDGTLPSTYMGVDDVSTLVTP